MQTIKLMLGIIIALLSVIIFELAQIISISSLNQMDFGIPIMIMVALGTVIILFTANTKIGANKKATLQHED